MKIGMSEKRKKEGEKRKMDELSYSANHVYREGYDEGFKDGQQSRWISTRERIPGSHELVIACIRGGGFNQRATQIKLGFFISDKWFDSNNNRYYVAGTNTRVIGWMPIPDPMEERKKK